MEPESRALDPNFDCIADIGKRFLGRFAVAHAAGQIRDGRQVAAAVSFR